VLGKAISVANGGLGSQDPCSFGDVAEDSASGPASGSASQRGGGVGPSSEEHRQMSPQSEQGMNKSYEITRIAANRITAKDTIESNPPNAFAS
jgi:hypothetical protein